MKTFHITNQFTSREAKITTSYFNDIAKYYVLTAEQEVELTQKIKEGCLESRNKLVEANLKFVVSVAKRYSTNGIDFQDLISEGNYGLIKAAERFDETKGFKFISFAIWWIRQCIGQAIIEQSSLIRLPQNVKSDISKKAKVVVEFEQVNFRTPTEDEIAEIMCLKEGDIFKLDNASKKIGNLDYKPHGFDDSQSIIDTYANKNSINPDSNLIKDSLNKDLLMAFKIAKLKERERLVLEKVYGLGGIEPLSISTVAEEMGYTTERIRQIKEEAEAKLKIRTKSEQEILNYQLAHRKKSQINEPVDSKNIHFLVSYL